MRTEQRQQLHLFWERARSSAGGVISQAPFFIVLVSFCDCSVSHTDVYKCRLTSPLLSTKIAAFAQISHVCWRQRSEGRKPFGWKDTQTREHPRKSWPCLLDTNSRQVNQPADSELPFPNEGLLSLPGRRVLRSDFTLKTTLWLERFQQICSHC